ncbi:hypothetical protein ANN_11214 [Periplaneta americana]|uniref:DUF4371 domain-containing protein n=1 Tax=Periplaneta americana TaxID=6978 RepID=A0ABQ8T4D7_PERAM|nr:hypothetical protein ANN_11214 [Periplaneta americana]
MGQSRNAYRVLVGRPEGKRPSGRPRRRWEDNIKMDLREVGYDDREWIHFAQDRDQWRAYVRTAMNLRLSCFGSVRIDTQLDQQLKSDVARHNEMVKKNREIMKSLIDTTCFLAMQVLPFRGHGENEDSLNKGNYIECLHLLSSYDTTLREHVESSTTFKGTSTEFKIT